MTALALFRRSAVTRLEIAFAVAVTSLLATLGYSAHRTYAARSQVDEGLAVAYGLAPYIARAFHRTREPPADQTFETAGELAARSLPFIDSISIDKGRLDVVFGDAADPALAGRQISLTPYETASLEVVWVCGNSADLVGLRPLGFAAGGNRAAPAKTTVERRYLPRQCR